MFFCPPLARAQASVPLVPGNWTQTWSDEFNIGSSDLSGWTHETGTNNGWGNSELEDYTSSSSNSYVANGNLNIAAIATTSDGKQTYTSARIKTSSLFSQTYGCFEFRAAMPAAMTSTGTGLWPAVWMLPQSSPYGGWPTSGEMDILEAKNSTYVQGSLHSGASSSTQYTQTGKYEPAGFDDTQFHTYDLVWKTPVGSSAGSIQWYVDGNLYETQTGGWYNPTGGSDPEAPFDTPFYFIIDLAVGGTYGGTPDLADGTYDMQIDYLRAYSTPEPAAPALLLIVLLALAHRRRNDASG